MLALRTSFLQLLFGTLKINLAKKLKPISLFFYLKTEFAKIWVWDGPITTHLFILFFLY